MLPLRRATKTPWPQRIAIIRRTCTHTHTHTHIQAFIHTHAYTLTHAHSCKHTLSHMCTHASIHSHTCAHMQRSHTHKGIMPADRCSVQRRVARFAAGVQASTMCEKTPQDRHIAAHSCVVDGGAAAEIWRVDVGLPSHTYANTAAAREKDRSSSRVLNFFVGTLCTQTGAKGHRGGADVREEGRIARRTGSRPCLHSLLDEELARVQRARLRGKMQGSGAILPHPAHI